MNLQHARQRAGVGTRTHLEPRKSEAPQTRGGVQNCRALRELPEDLKSRLEHERTEGSRERIGAGSNRPAGVPRALK